MKFFSTPLGFIQANCYIISSDKNNAVVIDPGAEAHKIKNHLEKNNLNLTKVFLTHGHHDHAAAILDLKKDYDFEVYASEFERDLLTQPELFFCSRAPYCDFEPLNEYNPLSDGDEIYLDELTFKFIHTPGHTKGSGVYLIEDKMFSGDTLFKGTCGRCDLYGGDYPTMLKSLKKLAELDGDYRVYPGHEAFTTLENERKTNPYMGTMSDDDYF